MPPIRVGSLLRTHYRVPIYAVAVVGLAIWFGGFTFYSGAVIWVLHDQLGSIEAGYISQQVSTQLNWVGTAALGAWWLVVALDREFRRGRIGKARIGLLALNSVLLASLFPLHHYLDQRLEQFGLTGFYRWHEYYLTISTVQWGVSLLFILLTSKLATVESR